MAAAAPSDYRENTRDSLVDLKITDSTELWLMQFPTNLGIDFDGQEVTLNLHREGKLGSVEGSSGKEYDLVSFSSQQPEATVFVSSSSESKIVGKISRLVSIVNYPEPSELVSNNQKVASLSTSSSAMKSSRTLTTPSRSIQRGSMSRSAASARSSKQKSALSEEFGEPLKTPKRQKSDRGVGSNLDSGNLPSGITSSGSMGNSHHKKSKTKTKRGVNLLRNDNVTNVLMPWVSQGMQIAERRTPQMPKVQDALNITKQNPDQMFEEMEAGTSHPRLTR
ncbi:hypothetical protein V2J09_023014 [Rumex salicifolius]